MVPCYQRTFICYRYQIIRHGPLIRYVNLRVAHVPGMPGTLSPPPRVTDPDLHHGTWVTQVSWCMSGFPLKLKAGKTFLVSPAHAQSTILRIWYEAHWNATGHIYLSYRCLASSNHGAKIRNIYLIIWWDGVIKTGAVIKGFDSAGIKIVFSNDHGYIELSQSIKRDFAVWCILTYKTHLLQYLRDIDVWFLYFDSNARTIGWIMLHLPCF